MKKIISNNEVTSSEIKRLIHEWSHLESVGFELTKVEHSLFKELVSDFQKNYYNISDRNEWQEYAFKKINERGGFKLIHVIGFLLNYGSKCRLHGENRGSNTIVWMTKNSP
ncbi:hypothetical protein [Pleionea mediterranea]|uniref:Uncharacterized protein n=1 Tax=Pleionea mediterranea TaxID=523701 RepID=A0A316FZ77_9GAMM|nr:hypothetical protein [Pleionea mediterranea]PWK53848.1 hypothetical protein C8D97_102238 [Pleionea mediterranea]